MSFILNIFLCLILLSCSNVVQIQKKRVKTTYSTETLRTFEEIERERAVERYRLMRKNNWKKYIQKRPLKKRKPRYFPPKKKRTVTPSSPPKSFSDRPVLKGEQREAIFTEMEQLASYFCMKNRKSTRFSNSGSCQAYSKKIIDECSNQVQNQIRDRKIVRCLKRKLNLR